MKKRRSAAQKRATARMIAARKRKLRGSPRKKRARTVAEAPRKRRRRARAPRGWRKGKGGWRPATRGAQRKHKAVKRRRGSARRKSSGPKRSYRRTAFRHGSGQRHLRKSSRHTRVQLDPFTGKYFAYEGPMRRKRRKSAKRRRKHVSREVTRRRRKKKPMGRMRRAARRGAKYIRVRRGGNRRPKYARRRVRRHNVRGHYKVSKRGKRYHVRAHRSYEAGAMENPLTGAELVVGALVGVIGFGASNLLDRFLATHAVQASTYMDQPGAGQTYNNVSVTAPMDMKRWGAGLAIAAVPLGLAQFIRNPMARTSLQFFGFGALIRVLGKGLDDGVSYLLGKKAIGFRLYEAELTSRAALKQAKTNPNVAPPPIPSVGIASVPQLGMGHVGYGSCIHGFAMGTGMGSPCGCDYAAAGDFHYTAPPQSVPAPPPAPAASYVNPNPQSYVPPTYVNPPGVQVGPSPLTGSNVIPPTNLGPPVPAPMPPPVPGPVPGNVANAPPTYTKPPSMAANGLLDTNNAPPITLRGLPGGAGARGRFHHNEG